MTNATQILRTEILLCHADIRAARAAGASAEELRDRWLALTKLLRQYATETAV